MNQQTINLRMQYIQARKQNGGYVLYYRGTRNQVFPGEVFKTARIARSYCQAMMIKGKGI